MRKRFLMTGVAIVLALSMVGCGKSSSETTTENATSEEVASETDVAEDTTTEAAQEFDWDKYDGDPNSRKLWYSHSLDGVIGYLDNDGADITCGAYTLTYDAGMNYYVAETDTVILSVNGYGVSGVDFFDEDMPEYYEEHYEDEGITSYYATDEREGEAVELVNSEGMTVKIGSYIPTYHDVEAGTETELDKNIVIAMENGLTIIVDMQSVGIGVSLDDSAYPSYEDLLPLTEGWVTKSEN